MTQLLIGKCLTMTLRNQSLPKAKKGIYPYHIKQWENDFIKSNTTADKPKKQSDDKQFKNKIKASQKELNRKNKALAETAALLVLFQKSILFGETARTAHYNTGT